MTIVGQLLYNVLLAFFLLLLFRLVMDYVFMFARSYQPQGPVLVLLEITYTITDPPLKFLRRFIPPLKLGNFSLDLSFLLLIIVVQILMGVVQRL
ncbi:MAG: YggT family protein [Actinomycetota bacterium]|nr:YggT family protein [Actinomycetota bacterium]